MQFDGRALDCVAHGCTLFYPICSIVLCIAVSHPVLCACTPCLHYFPVKRNRCHRPRASLKLLGALSYTVHRVTQLSYVATVAPCLCRKTTENWIFISAKNIGQPYPRQLHPYLPLLSPTEEQQHRGSSPAARAMPVSPPSTVRWWRTESPCTNMHHRKIDGCRCGIKSGSHGDGGSSTIGINREERHQSPSPACTTSFWDYRTRTSARTGP